MRGSVYYQTSVLVKMVFKEGALKVNRIDPESDSYMCIASFNTMNSYRQIWNNFGLYIKELYGIKDFEKSTALHVEDYLRSKLADGISKQYFQKLCAALNKLVVALEKFNENFGVNNNHGKKEQIKGIAMLQNVYNIESEHIKRAYSEPENIIDNLDSYMFKIAAKIQLEGGARYKGIHKIKIKQLKGIKVDEVTDTKVGIIETKEKGGRVGDVYVSVDTYMSLKEVLLRDGKFEINYEKYAKSIRKSCLQNNVKCHGSHGFRWNFAKRRIVKYQDAGYSYDESLLKLSTALKHNRKIISEHYVG